MEITFETRDEFNRKPVAEKLIRLLSSEIEVSPMLIDGGWGSGKTEFCRKLIHLMKEEKPNCQTVYLDAFCSDHSGEPLLALLAQIIKDCTPEDKANGEQSKKRKEFTDKLVKAVGFTAKTVAKAAAGHLLKQSAENLAEDFQTAFLNKEQTEKAAETASETAVKLADQAIDATVEILLKEQVEAEKNLMALKNCLAEFAAEKPLILFIDELDRCRPDYAVEMLEMVKHVFDIPNVKVVLVTNSQQLYAAINHRYGLAVDAYEYLDKFLKYRFRLPEKDLSKPSFVPQESASVTYFGNLIHKSAILNKTQLAIGDSYIVEFAQCFIEYHQISLRETETFVRYLEIYHLYHENGFRTAMLGYQLLRFIGVFIHCFEPNIARSVYADKADAKQVAALFGLTELPNCLSEEYTNIPYQRKLMNSIAVMLAQDCALNNQIFIPINSDESEFWNGEKKSYFKYGYYAGMPNTVALVKSVIQRLQLEQVD